MAIRQITNWQDDRFDKTSRPIDKFDPRLHTLLDDMLDTLREVDGYGCAAVHVGILRRAVVIDDPTGVIELINPMITHSSPETQLVKEGSIAEGAPWGMVNRPVAVTVTASDRTGQPITLTGEGFLAATLCHEIDHLDGIRFSTKLTPHQP